MSVSEQMFPMNVRHVMNQQMMATELLKDRPVILTSMIVKNIQEGTALREI